MLTRAAAIAATVLLALFAALAPAAAQKQGGTLRIYHRDNPPSASLHEEATVSVTQPFMAVFNNLVLFDQTKPLNSLDTIVPELGESWSWDASNTKLTFKLRRGRQVARRQAVHRQGRAVHLARADRQRRAGGVQQEPAQGLVLQSPGGHDRRRPRGDVPSRHPQPSFLMLLASGFSPVYPCHVSQRDMRTKPIGTGPFKFVELSRNVGIKLVRNPDYWKKGKPYLDAIEMRIIESRSTRILAFVSGEFDMTFDRDVTVPLMKDVKAQAPKADLPAGPHQRQHQPGRKFRRSALRQSADPQSHGAGARSQGLHRHSHRGQGADRRRDAAGPRGPVGDAAGGAGPAAGLRRPTSPANLAEAQKIMAGLGYGPGKPLKVKVSVRNIAIYRDPAVILIDQLKKIHIQGELEADRHHGVVRQGAAPRLFGQPQPDGRRRRRPRR